MFKPNPTPVPWAERMHTACYVLLVFTWGTSSALPWLNVEAVVVSCIDTVLLLTGTACTLIGLGRRLPVQNVLMAALVIAFIPAGVVSVGGTSGWLFGSFAFTDRMGAKLFGILPWPIPLLWIVIILNARAVAELILRPWRRAEYYGYGVMGVACLLVGLLDFGLDPFAVKVKSLWIWNGNSTSLNWHTAPWLNVLGGMVTTLLGLVFSAPWLINKRPVKEVVDVHPLILWSMLSLWLALGQAAHQLWSPLGVTLASGVTVVILALRGARSGSENG